MLQGEVTELLLAWSAGKEGAREELLPLVYRELRRRASNTLRSERAGHTMQTTDLVHEVYCKLAGQRRVRWRDRAHFYAVCSTLMRRALVDHARRHVAKRRGAGVLKVPLSEAADAALTEIEVEIIALDEALTELAAVDANQARIVELRFFGGLSVMETARAVRRSRATVHREWAMARAWLRRRVGGTPEDP